MKRYRVSGELCLYGTIEIEWTMTLDAKNSYDAEELAYDAICSSPDSVDINDVEELEDKA